LDEKRGVEQEIVLVAPLNCLQLAACKSYAEVYNFKAKSYSLSRMDFRTWIYQCICQLFKFHAEFT
jgi:hypothetical protein